MCSQMGKTESRTDDRTLDESKDNEELTSIDFAPIFFPEKHRQVPVSPIDLLARKYKIND